MKSGSPLLPSVWLAFANVIGTTDAVAAKPAIEAVPAKKFLLFKFGVFFIPL
jgi:hypothetical protein